VLRRVPVRARHLHLLVLVALAAALLPAGAASAQSSINTVVSITFPVHDPDGLTTYRDDYHDPRGGGTRVHMATDIGGARADGLRIHAAVGGTITWITRLDGANVGTAGYALGIRGDDGHTYRYMHLGRDAWGPDRAYAPGMAVGRASSEASSSATSAPPATPRPTGRTCTSRSAGRTTAATA
jgi:hypothetical protein